MRRISTQEQKETQYLTELIRRYPEHAMQQLAAYGIARFAALYKEASGIDISDVMLVHIQDYGWKLVDVS